MVVLMHGMANPSSDGEECRKGTPFPSKSNLKTNSGEGVSYATPLRFILHQFFFRKRWYAREVYGIDVPSTVDSFRLHVSLRSLASVFA